MRDYGKTIEKRRCRRSVRFWPRSSSTTCSWVLFDIGTETYFMYQGIFDTDFDKYTDDAVALFMKAGINTVIREPGGFSRGLEDEHSRLQQVRPRASAAELPGIRGVPLRDGR